MWRPEGWGNPYDREKWGPEFSDMHLAEKGNAFELGADALLAALKKEGSYFRKGAEVITHSGEEDDIIVAQRGHIVFIPGNEYDII